MENVQDKTTAKKDFASLPAQLRELVLSKTHIDTRLKLFQINNELREWVLEEELFGEDLVKIVIFEPSEFPTVRYQGPGSKRFQDPSSERYQHAYFETRNGSRKQINLINQYVFKVVRRCKELRFSDGDFTLTRTFPRLQSVNCFIFPGTNLTRLSQIFTGQTIQITGSSLFPLTDLERTKRNNEIFLQFIENHMKRCKIVHFGEYPFEKLFDFLGTQRFSHAITECFESDLKMVLRNGIPGLHADSAIWMIIRASNPGMNGLIRIIRIISKGTDVVMKHEAIRKKFLVSYGKVDGFPASGRFLYGQIQFFNCSEIEFFGLKRKFDDKRNLIFLVYPIYYDKREYINIHVKFDPIEE